MAELGELERRHADCERRNTRIVVISVEGSETAKQTQAAFPHLAVVTDADRGLSNVADVIHRHSAPDGGDTAAPATLLVDREGIVRWQYRPNRYLTRLSPDDLLAAIDQYLASRQ